MACLHGPQRIGEDLLPALLEEELADAPGVQILDLLGPAHPLLVPALAEELQPLRSVAGLHHGHGLVPMAALGEQPPDLLVHPPADGAALQEMRYQDPLHLLVLQIPCQPSCQRLQRRMIVCHGIFSFQNTPQLE